MGKTETAWRTLIERFHIIEAIDKRGYFKITAEQIKTANREVRLMTKFDHFLSLPSIFQANQLSILPLSRNEFIIGRFDVYHELADDVSLPVKKMPIPALYKSLGLDKIISEQMALLAANVSGIIADFLDDNTVSPTIEGRQSSGAFTFTIFDKTIGKERELQVNNAQIEIDAAYEGKTCLAIFEAKQGVVCEDVLIRQLFYPYMCWSHKIDKPIRLVYLVYQDGLYKLFEYAPNGNDYSGFHLIKQKNYTICAKTISKGDIDKLVLMPTVDEPEIPFPQANDFGKVIHLLEYLGYDVDSADAEEIATELSVVSRQSSYYTAALAYLGLCESVKHEYRLTKKGEAVLKMQPTEKMLTFAELVLQHKAFNEAYKKADGDPEKITKEDIVAIMKECHLYNINKESTLFRRSSTILGWLKWLCDLDNY